MLGWISKKMIRLNTLDVEEWERETCSITSVDEEVPSTVPSTENERIVYC